MIMAIFRLFWGGQQLTPIRQEGSLRRVFSGNEALDRALRERAYERGPDE